MKYFYILLYFFSINIFAQPPLIILIGPPGCGKGTQANLIQKEFFYPHISTGDLLRNHINKKTETGSKIQEYIAVGSMVPDNLILNMLYERVSLKDCSKGVIIDGSSRTVNQARFLYQTFANEYNLIILFFQISKNTAIQRVCNRKICNNCNMIYNNIFCVPQIENVCDICKNSLFLRVDDVENIVNKRLKFYNEQFYKLKKFYKQQENVFFIDAEKSIENIYSSIKKILINLDYY